MPDYIPPRSTVPRRKDERTDDWMRNNSTGTFMEVDLTMCETIREITNRGNDCEVRKRYDGTYDVFELEKKKPKPRKENIREPLPIRG